MPGLTRFLVSQRSKPARTPALRHFFARCVPAPCFQHSGLADAARSAIHGSGIDWFNLALVYEYLKGHESIFLLSALSLLRGALRCPGGRIGRRARPAHGLVPRRPVRAVHPLGRLFGARGRVERQDQLRRVVPGRNQDARSQYEKFAGQFNPGEVRRQGMGPPGQRRRDEIHRHHLQAPRRLRHVPLRPDGLVHQVHARSSATRSRSWPTPAGGRHQALLLPLHHGLAPSGLGHAPRLERQGHRHARTWTATPPT